jgi:NAD+ diphosphatase
MASRARESRLALLTTTDVELFLGPKPYFGQGPSEGAIAAVDLPILEAARFRGAPIVFLGLCEPQDNGYSPAVPHEELAKALVGTPFFSIDISEVSQSQLDRLVQTSTAATDGFNLSFAEARGAMRGMDEFDAGVFAEARSMVDWNSRNKVCGRFVVFHRLALIRHFAQFCASCGSHVYSIWGGWKLSCTSLLSSSDNTGRKPCPTQFVSLLFCRRFSNITIPCQEGTA